MTLQVRRNAACESTQDPSVGELIRKLIYTRMLSVIQDPFLPAPAPPTPPTFSSILAQSKSAERMSSVLPIFATAPLSAEGRIAPALMEISARRLRDSNVPSSPLCASPQELFPCNGWCAPDPNANAPTVVSFPAVLYASHPSLAFVYIHAGVVGSMFR